MKSQIFLLLILLPGFVFSQSLEERRTYYDPLSRAYLHEAWTVIAGTATKHGTYKEFDKQGGLIIEASFKNNKLNGEYKRYYLDYQTSSGVLKQKHIYKDDFVIEEWSYFKDGTKNYHKRIDGDWTYWHRNGQVGMKASLHPGGQWADGDAFAPKGDDLFIKNGLGQIVKVKEIKWYFQDGKLSSENYFNQDGISIKNITYSEPGRKKSEWFKQNNSDTYTEVLYYENFSKAVSTEFVLVPMDQSKGRNNILNIVKQGIQTRWDEGGAQVNQGSYLNDRRVGVWKVYYNSDFTEEVYLHSEAGYYRTITYDQQGKISGVVKDYFISGQLQWEGQLLEEFPDKPHGECKRYYQNGQLQSIRNFNAGANHGAWTLFSENGVKTREDQWSNGQIASRTMWSDEGVLQITQKFGTISHSDYGTSFGSQAMAREVFAADSKWFYGNETLESEGYYLVDTYKGSQTKLGVWKYYDTNGKVIKEEYYNLNGELTNKPK